MSDFNIHRVKVGDVLKVTRDGRTYDMEVFRIDPPGTFGTSYAAGPHIAVRIRPGGYAFTFDQGNILAGQVEVQA